MPEGDTIHKIAAFLQPRLVGERLVVARAAHSRLGEFEGRPVDAVRVHGKHLMVHCADWILRVHLGMYGSWHQYPLQAPWHKPRGQASVVLSTAREVFVCFNAMDVECLVASAVASSVVGSLGPDLLAATWHLDAVVRRARRLAPHSALTDLLLNQHVAAGIGNVLKCEVLFIHELHPMLACHTQTTAALQALYTTARQQMQCNIGGWRRTTTYDRREGERPHTPRLFVYGRKGQPCSRCATSIAKATLGTSRRITYWCPRCQDITPA